MPLILFEKRKQVMGSAEGIITTPTDRLTGPTVEVPLELKKNAQTLLLLANI